MGAETNEPVTDRIEAIRARHESGHWTPAGLLREEVAVLLAEVDRLTAEAEDWEEQAEATRRLRNEARAEVERVKVLLQSARDSEDDLEAERTAVQDNLNRAVARIDEIERWALDHFGDTTDLAFAFWGMPSAADLAPFAPDAEPGGAQ